MAMKNHATKKRNFCRKITNKIGNTKGVQIVNGNGPAEREKERKRDWSHPPAHKYTMHKLCHLHLVHTG